LQNLNAGGVDMNIKTTTLFALLGLTVVYFQNCAPSRLSTLADSTSESSLSSNQSDLAKGQNSLTADQRNLVDLLFAGRGANNVNNQRGSSSSDNSKNESVNRNTNDVNNLTRNSSTTDKRNVSTTTRVTATNSQNGDDPRKRGAASAQNSTGPLAQNSQNSSYIDETTAADCTVGQQFDSASKSCVRCGSGIYASKPKYSASAESCVARCDLGISIQLAWMVTDDKSEYYLSQIGFVGAEGFKIVRNGTSYDAGFVGQNRTFYNVMNAAKSNYLSGNEHIEAFRLSLLEVPGLQDLQVTQGKLFTVPYVDKYGVHQTPAFTAVNIIGTGDLDLTRWTIKSPGGLGYPSKHILHSYISCY
jgi:hypothetical protein